MSTNPYEPPKDQQPARRSPLVPGRFQVLGTGFVVGAVIAVFLSMGFSANWICIVTGPIAAIEYGFLDAAIVGLVGALLAIVHPVKPNGPAGCVTAIGVALWFLSGLATMATLYAK